MITPLEFIAALREIYPGRYDEHSGGCLKFHRLLKAVFPDATGYYNSDHIITEIEGDFFDIDGTVENFGDFLPIDEFGEQFIESTFGHVLHLDAS